MLDTFLLTFQFQQQNQKNRSIKTFFGL